MANDTSRNTDLIVGISQALTEISASPSGYAEAFVSGAPPAGDNQFLLFLKPELFQDGVSFDAVFALVMDKLTETGLMVESAQALSGRYLETHQIASSHYGVIDAVSRDPMASLSDQARTTFAAIFGKPVTEAPVVGSLVYLENHPDADTETLSRDWLSRGFKKLAGGTYCQHIADEDVYLINGFYPRMLEHYTGQGSLIVSLVVSGEIPWARARTFFIGATDPAQAEPGSIRKELLERNEEFGIPVVNSSLNGFHLSAGPVEGLVELMRFTTNYSNSQQRRPYTDFVFGRMLRDAFSSQQIESILRNVDVSSDGAQVSIFDLTEEMDSGQAISTLQGFSGQLG